MPDQGSAPNKSFVRQYSVYTGSDCVQQADAAGVLILSVNQDGEGNDVATALNNRIFRDGGNTPTADLPMGTQKHTNVGDATARSNYSSAGQVADNALRYAGTSSGTDTITVSLSPAITVYVTGQQFSFKAGGTN